MSPTIQLVNGSGRKKLTLTRLLDASKELVFRAWTDTEQMKEWWGPHHFTNPVCEMDVRPGGAIHIDMKAPDGLVFPMDGCFHEVDSPNRLVFTSAAFEDEFGNTQLENLNTITFSEENGKTKLTVQATVLKSSPEADAALDGMEEGWSQSLEKLECLLKKHLNKNTMTQINAYLNFKGNCREAMTFYKEAVGGELTLQAIKDTPMADQCPTGKENEIMHSTLIKQGLVLMASDMIGPDGFHQGNNISLCVNCSSEEEINRFFNALAAGGKIIDPLKIQFWGALFGVLTDKFGIRWLFNYDKNAQ